MNNTSSKLLQTANIIGFLIVIAANALANVLPIGGRNTGEVSALYDNLFVPAGYAFSIWGLIYSLLLIFVILQAKGIFRKNKPAPDYVSDIGWWFFISCLANAGWIVAWHNLLLPISVVLMLLILGSLIAVYIRMGIGRATVTSPFWARLPFSAYLGWITIATVANVAALLVSTGWNGFVIPEVTWTVSVLIIATLIALAVLWTRKDLAYVLVVIWAFAAIIVRRQVGDLPEDRIVVTTVWIAIAFLVVGILGRFLIKKPS